MKFKTCRYWIPPYSYHRCGYFEGNKGKLRASPIMFQVVVSFVLVGRVCVMPSASYCKTAWKDYIHSRGQARVRTRKRRGAGRIKAAGGGSRWPHRKRLRDQRPAAWLPPAPGRWLTGQQLERRSLFVQGWPVASTPGGEAAGAGR